MSYHPAKFSGHRHSDSDSRDIMIFVCHVTLQDTSSGRSVALWLEAFQVTILSSLVAIRTVVEKI